MTRDSPILAPTTIRLLDRVLRLPQTRPHPLKRTTIRLLDPVLRLPPPPPAAEDQTPPAQENEDPFADDAAAAPAAGPAPRSPSAAKGGGPLGAVFRAMTRSATDNPALKQGQSLLQNARGAMPGGAPAPGGPVVVPSEPPDQDPFFEGNPDENAAPAAKPQGTPLPEEDPLPTNPVPPPQPTAPPPPAPADEMDPAAADDPFADENP